MAVPHSSQQLVGRIEALDQQLRRAQAKAQAAEEKALLAQRSAREAWGFVKALRAIDRHV